MVKMDNAQIANNATNELKKMIDLFEANYQFPSIPCEIPYIGEIRNLFNYTWYHLHFAIETELVQSENEAFKYHFNQANIILSYLINEGLISGEITQIKQTVKREVLELHCLFTFENQHGRLDRHPQREQIRNLWQRIMKDYHTPQLQQHLTQLKQIVI